MQPPESMDKEQTLMTEVKSDPATINEYNFGTKYLLVGIKFDVTLKELIVDRSQARQKFHTAFRQVR